MKYEERVLATTHLDNHNQRFSRQALESMVKQINKQYVPMGIEHDPRVPPIGRAISAKPEQADDGEYRVVATTEVFEAGDEIPLKNDGREIPLHRYDETPTIIFDRSYKNPEDKKILEDIVNHVSGELQEEGKKALDPVSVLIFAFAGIAAGFLNQSGSDLYDSFKNKMKKLLASKRTSELEHLVVFRAVIKRNDYFVQVDTYLTNPRDEDFDYFLAEGLKRLDIIVPELIERNEDLRKYVFECENEKLTLKFAVRKDEIPFMPTLEEEIP